MPCVVGRGGVAQKQGEGDNISPLGCWRVLEFLFRSDRVRLEGSTPIGLRDAWCDNPDSLNYNTKIKVNGPNIESLRRSDPMYDVIGVLDYNSAPTKPGLGSAIFLHSWRRPGYPTAGCIAFARTDMLWIAQNWRGGQVIIQARWR